MDGWTSQPISVSWLDALPMWWEAPALSCLATGPRGAELGWVFLLLSCVKSDFELKDKGGARHICCLRTLSSLTLDPLPEHAELVSSSLVIFHDLTAGDASKHTISPTYPQDHHPKHCVDQAPGCSIIPTSSHNHNFLFHGHFTLLFSKDSKSQENIK